MLEVLTRYCRTSLTLHPWHGGCYASGEARGANLQLRAVLVKRVKERVVKRAFYSDEEDESDEEEVEIGFEEGVDEEEPSKVITKDSEVDIDHDHRLTAAVLSTFAKGIATQV